MNYIPKLKDNKLANLCQILQKLRVHTSVLNIKEVTKMTGIV